MNDWNARGPKRPNLWIAGSMLAALAGCSSLGPSNSTGPAPEPTPTVTAPTSQRGHEGGDAKPQAASTGADAAAKVRTAEKAEKADKADKASDKTGTAEKGANGQPVDRSGQAKSGKASFYARHFEGRKMADGTKMDPNDDNAASKTLPLGTKARVTNKETGQSAVVTIQDRGPYVKGRIVDLSPKTAKQIGITPKDGVADVEVKPIALPKPGGGTQEADARTSAE